LPDAAAHVPFNDCGCVRGLDLDVGDAAASRFQTFCGRIMVHAFNEYDTASAFSSVPLIVRCSRYLGFSTDKRQMNLSIDLI
jgi:hypothetical protein